MKMPRTPPDVAFDRLDMTVLARDVRHPTVGGKYLHWDDLRHRAPPAGLDHEQWWSALKFWRQSQYREVPEHDTRGLPFQYALTDHAQESLHDIDSRCAGRIQMPEPITNPATRDQYYIGSLMEEAITSSQLEGATTTRQVAKQMLRAGRAPADRSERMILNNYLTMRRIADVQSQTLTPALVLDLHKLVTQGTLDDPTAAGRTRKADESVVVGDEYGNVFHEPPHAAELAQRMQVMCDFANRTVPDFFIPPVIRAIILHFWLAYDHPFIDGNGRTARALFYWSMLNSGYWLFEFISISEIILKGPVKYGRAFLLTETDDNDLTYFIDYHLRVIRRAVASLYEYIQRKTERLQLVEGHLRGVTVLNHRQRALISHALRHPHHVYTVMSHRNSHGIVNQTARTDLQDLVERGLLVQDISHKQARFYIVDELEKRLATLK